MIGMARIDAGLGRRGELLALIRSPFAYMDAVIDPPSIAAGLHVLQAREAALYIGKLAIAPHAQGKSLGRALVGEAEETARKRRLSVLRLETRIELVRNHATFGRWGFEKTAEKAHPGFTRPTFIQLRKRLG